ncbi:MAG: hypothetical protein ACM31C_01795, partial [Acidobacteriota bacterium]
MFPYFPRLHSANELPRLYQVKAIVVDHTFAIDREVAEWGPTMDLAKHGGHTYPNKAPGSSLLAVPVYAAVTWTVGEPSLATAMWLCRFVTCVVPSLVFLWLLWGFLARFAPDEPPRRLALVAYALGSMAMTYSVLYYSHQLSAVCIGGAWILALDVAERRRGLRAMVVAGLLAGAAPLVDYEAAFAGIPVAVHVLWKLRGWPRKELARAIAAALAGAAIPIALLAYYQLVCFGGHTGYAFAIDKEHERGLLGMTHPGLAAMYGTTLAPDNGFFVLAPWWLVAIPGGVALWRRGDRAFVAVAVAVAALYFGFVWSLDFPFWRGGWEVGPRYIVAMQPFLLPLVAAGLASLRERPLALAIAAGAIVAGVAVYALSAATLPQWPNSLRDPLYEVTLRLLANDAVAPNAGGALGISGVAGIVPYLALVAGVTGWAIWRAAGARALAIAAVV